MTAPTPGYDVEKSSMAATKLDPILVVFLNDCPMVGLIPIFSNCLASCDFTGKIFLAAPASPALKPAPVALDNALSPTPPSEAPAP